MNGGPTRFLETGPGRTAALQGAVIRAAGGILGRTGGRGIATAVDKVGKLFPSRNFGILGVAGVRLKVDLRDSYWLAPLLRGGYEPEINHVLRRVLSPDDAFVDCGANIGYWSAAATRVITDSSRVIAIEASSRMYERLSENSVLNGRAFQCVHAALWHTSDRRVEIAVDDERHSWASAHPATRDHLQSLGFRSEQVQTITVDDAVERYVRGGFRRLVLKVDVEGSELDVFAGADRSLARDSVVIYEEHGRDEDSPVSAMLLANDMMAVFFCDADLNLRQIHDHQAIKRTKQEKRRGYNFFVCNKEMPVYGEMLDLVR